MGYENKNYNINNNEIEENKEENNKKGFLSWFSSIFLCRKEKNKIINKKSFEYHEKKEKKSFSIDRDIICHKCCCCCEPEPKTLYPYIQNMILVKRILSKKI